MKKTMRNKKASGVFILVLIAVFTVSMAMSYFYLKGKFEFDSSFIEEILSRQAITERKEQKEDTRRLYESKETAAQSDNDSWAVKNSSLAAAEDSIRKYLKTYEARLLDLYMDKDGVVYVDMGNELKKNFKGDASEELNIIAGLYRNIEPEVPGFTALKILIEGHETETIGGHIDISKPVGKEIAENI
jgi:hypothetical protein